MVWNFDSLIPKDLHRLKEFENNLLSTTAGPKKEKVTA
jgi:hypothetical protein